MVHMKFVKAKLFFKHPDNEEPYPLEMSSKQAIENFMLVFGQKGFTLEIEGKDCTLFLNENGTFEII
jgi:hypothetical protein